MTRTRTLLGIALFAGVAVLAVGALGSSAYAQSPIVAAAIADGTVGEQSDVVRLQQDAKDLIKSNPELFPQ